MKRHADPDIPNFLTVTPGPISALTKKEKDGKKGERKEKKVYPFRNDG